MEKLGAATSRAAEQRRGVESPRFETPRKGTVVLGQAQNSKCKAMRGAVTHSSDLKSKGTAPLRRAVIRQHSKGVAKHRGATRSKGKALRPKAPTTKAKAPHRRVLNGSEKAMQ